MELYDQISGWRTTQGAACWYSKYLFKDQRRTGFLSVALPTEILWAAWISPGPSLMWLFMDDLPLFWGKATSVCFLLTGEYVWASSNSSEGWSNKESSEKTLLENMTSFLRTIISVTLSSNIRGQATSPINIHKGVMSSPAIKDTFNLSVDDTVICGYQTSTWYHTQETWLYFASLTHSLRFLPFLNSESRTGRTKTVECHSHRKSYRKFRMIHLKASDSIGTKLNILSIKSTPGYGRNSIRPMVTCRKFRLKLSGSKQSAQV